jgi:hypothetical protein
MGPLAGFSEVRALRVRAHFGPFVSAAKIPFPLTETTADRDSVRVCGAIIAQEGRASGAAGTIPPASR